MTRLTTMPDEQGVAQRAAREIARHLTRAGQDRGVAHLALSGGTTPRLTYELLAGQFDRWELVEVWFVDERCVSAEDEQSNYLLARETLLEPAEIDPSRVHRMEGELGPYDGASAYTQELRDALPAAPARGREPALPTLDVAVLGIGPDAHVASLFPGAATLQAPSQALCLPVTDSPKPPPERITLSLAMLRAARRSVLVATGSAKADALSALMAQPSPHVPASLLRRERMTIVADDAASPPAPLR